MKTAPAVHLSIHDVMPETLSRVEALIDTTTRAGWPPPVLLVVPDAGWDAQGIQKLRDWQARGHELAGHGWQHQISGYGGLWHRIHAALISRDVAEHLSLDAEGILNLMQRSFAWFGEQGLTRPSLYVPPAWALGSLPRHRLDEQPFEQVETLRGIYSVSEGIWRYRALLGYEAGNGFQRLALELSNALNRKRAPRAGLRIGLHPYDASLPLADALVTDLNRFRPQPTDD